MVIYITLISVRCQFKFQNLNVGRLRISTLQPFDRYVLLFFTIYISSLSFRDLDVQSTGLDLWHSYPSLA